MKYMIDDEKKVEETTEVKPAEEVKAEEAAK